MEKYKVFNGFRKVGEYNDLKQAEAEAEKEKGGLVSIRHERKTIYQAYHHEAKMYKHGYS